MSDEEKLVSHYRLKTLLRRDGFGAVYFAEDTRDQKGCVLRIIELDQATLTRITGRVRARSQRDHPLIEQIRQRMKRISELKNSHILPVIEFGEEHIQGNNDIIFYMVSPYEKESLLSYWSERTSSAELISLEIVAELIFQAAEALYYVHRRGLVHQYVRLSSFMLRATTRARRLHLYLTDFWFADISAALLEEGQIAQDLSVYLASEQLAGAAVGASDQYALAILAYELLLGYRLSQVDLSLGLYERFVRQRGIEVSEAELQLARRLDLVLARALAENVTARYQNIEEFALAFRGVASGEDLDFLEEDTTKLPAISGGERGGSQRVEEIAVAAAGTLAAGEIVEELVETRVEFDESTYARHPSLHKTVLTTEGMEIIEGSGGGEVVEETVLSEEATIISGTAQGGTFVAEEETLTAIEGEETQSTVLAAGAAGFAADLAVGEAFQSETDLSMEQTQIVESNMAMFAAGEARQRETDIAEEQTLIAEGAAAAFAAGLAAGEASQRETDLAEERTERRESGAAGFATGAAAGLAADEVLTYEQETDIAGEQTQIISSSGGGFGDYEGETDVEEEQTQGIAAAGGALLAGAAGLVVGELLAAGLGETEVAGVAGLAGSEFLTGGLEGTEGAGAAGAGGMSVIEQAEMVGGAAAAGLAAEGYAGSGAASGGSAGRAGTGYAGDTTQTAGGGATGAAAGLAGAGLAAEGYAGGGAAGGGAAGGAGEGYAGDTTQVAGGGAAGIAAGGLAGAGLAAGGVAGGAAGGTGTVGAGGVAASGGSAPAGGAGAAGLAGAGLAAGGYAGSGTAGGGVAGGTTQSAGGGVVGGGILPPSSQRRRRGGTLLAAIILVLLLLLVSGGLVFALNQSTATVTLTLESHTIQNTYLVTATTNTTTTNGQVQANFLTQTVVQSQSGQASGYYAGVEANGYITIRNSSTGCGCPVFVPAGTAFTGASGVTVVIDYGVSVASLCSVTVPAHAMVYGSGGDIPAGDVHAAYSAHLSASNPYAFTGGQAGQSNALVQQSDIDHLAKTLQTQVVQSAQTGLQAQLKSNQHLFAQPVCQSKTTSDHPSGSHASSVNVTVSTTCSGEAYDYSAAVQTVQQQVQTEASSYSSDQFILVNGLQTTVTSATITDAKAGTILLAIKAVGRWVHRLSNDQKQTLLRVIAGKSVSDARSILSQFGASTVAISVSGRDSNTLPSDSSKITIVLKS